MISGALNSADVVYFNTADNRLGQYPFSYIDTTGKVRQGSIQWLVNPGTYYLVFDNRNIILETNVMIQSSFELSSE